jgi:hypothetical protein
VFDRLQVKVDFGAPAVILKVVEGLGCSTTGKKERKMRIVADKGKIKIGGGAINLIKPAVTDKGKIKIGGGNISLIKPTKK